MSQTRIGLLGPLRVHDETGAPVELGGSKQRAVLAMLAVTPGAVVSVDVLTQGVWGEHPPGNAGATLQVYISNLRRALAGGGAQGRDLIRRSAPGYLLDSDSVDVDLTGFRQGCREGMAMSGAGRPAAAAARLQDALAGWRGTAVEDLADLPFAATVRETLELERVGVAIACLRAQTDSGSHEETIAQARALLGEHPMREPLWELMILALYRAGRQAEAVAVFGEVREMLAEELGVDPGQELQALHAAVLNQDAALQVRLARVRAAAVPVPLTVLLGREGELAELGRLLRSPDRRLVTLCGLGGIGKTHLALVATAAAAPTFSGGAIFCSLADAADGADLRRLLATVLEAASAADLEEHLRSQEPSLLLLDNLEQVVGATDEIRHLLEAAPQHRVLATSRVPLGIAGETVLRVQGLTAPEDTSGEDPSVTLFIDRLKERRPGFEPTSADSQAITDIARAADGVPLVLELLAGRHHLMTLPEIAARLVPDRSMLTGGRRSDGRNVAAVVSETLQLLDAPARTAFGCLAVFPDGATVELAQAVLGSGDMLEDLAALADANLIQVVEGFSGRRLRMLVPVREVAARLDLVDETLRERHAVAVAAYLAARLARWSDPDSVAAYAEMRAETDNALSALRWTVERDRPELALDILDSWRCLSQLPTICAAILVLLPGMKDRTTDHLLGARLDLHHGILAHHANHLGDVVEQVAAALTNLRQAMAPDRSMALGEILLAVTYAERGDRAQAQSWSQIALQDTSPATPGSAHAERGTTLHGSAYVARLVDDAAQAKIYVEEAWALCEAVGDLRGMAMNGGELSAVLLDAGEPKAARDAALRTMEVAQRIDLAAIAAIATANLAGAALLGGDPEEAFNQARKAALMADALAACEDITADALALLAATLAEVGETQMCAHILGAREAVLVALGIEIVKAPLFVRPYLDAAHSALGDAEYDEAVRAGAEACARVGLSEQLARVARQAKTSLAGKVAGGRSAQTSAEEQAH